MMGSVLAGNRSYRSCRTVTKAARELFVEEIGLHWKGYPHQPTNKDAWLVESQACCDGIQMRSSSWRSYSA
jgi:hypothetical protein